MPYPKRSTLDPSSSNVMPFSDFPIRTTLTWPSEQPMVANPVESDPLRVIPTQKIPNGHVLESAISGRGTFGEFKLFSNRHSCNIELCFFCTIDGFKEGSKSCSKFMKQKKITSNIKKVKKEIKSPPSHPHMKLNRDGTFSKYVDLTD